MGCVIENSLKGQHFLIPKSCGSEAWWEAKGLPIALLGELPSWKTGELQKVLIIALFPEIKFLRNWTGCQKWDQYRPECLDIFFPLAFWKVNEIYTYLPGPHPHTLCVPHRTSLCRYGFARLPHFNLKSKTSKLFLTCALDWHLWVKLWIQNTPIHSHSLRERGVYICVYLWVRVHFLQIIQVQHLS